MNGKEKYLTDDLGDLGDLGDVLSILNKTLDLALELSNDKESHKKLNANMNEVLGKIDSILAASATESMHGNGYLRLIISNFSRVKKIQSICFFLLTLQFFMFAFMFYFFYK
jgi:hypothetical protein